MGLVNFAYTAIGFRIKYREVLTGEYNGDEPTRNLSGVTYDAHGGRKAVVNGVTYRAFLSCDYGGDQSEYVYICVHLSVNCYNPRHTEGAPNYCPFSLEELIEKREKLKHDIESLNSNVWKNHAEFGIFTVHETSVF